MKSKKKIVTLLACAVLLVVGSVMGTMAYLTSQDEVTNTFTVGNVKITLDEAPVNENGDATTGERVKANSYKLLPGHEYDKDPTVHVDANSEACWLFVKVENGITDIEDADTILTQMGSNGWTLVADETNVYAYESIVKGGDNKVVFETFKVKGDANVSEYTDAAINVTAYAVQADGFDTAAKAWSAAKTTGDIE